MIQTSYSNGEYGMQFLDDKEGLGGGEVGLVRVELGLVEYFISDPIAHAGDDSFLV